MILESRQKWRCVKCPLKCKLSFFDDTIPDECIFKINKCKWSR